MNNSNIKTAVFWVVIIMLVVLFWTVVHTTKSRPDAQLSYTQLMNDVNASKIKSVTISGNDPVSYTHLGGTTRSASKFP